MNYRSLWQDVEMQNDWADDLSRHQSRNDKEPADSQRLLLNQDDKESGD